jgi:cellulose synthase/poly-beta-1,6-N-acetylglucosamine synthase-like glycosyltransferase
MVLVTALAALAAVILLAPAVSDLLSLSRIAVRPMRGGMPSSAETARLLVLVPAHDEELLIDACLRSLTEQRYPKGRMKVAVIADNCTDRTAALSRAAGALCLERHDQHHPGKPQAIAWALEQLPVRSFDAVVIVDADTRVNPDFARELSAKGPLRGKALQPFNGVLNHAENALTRMAGVLATADHGLAYALKTRAGLNVPLSAGMCVGADLLADGGWHAFSVCEDWELYALLTERGARIEGVPRARLYAEEAPTLAASSTQRRRWTAGKLTVLAKRAWPLLRSRHIGVAQKLDALAELSRPGPALHLGLAAAGVVGAVIVHAQAGLVTLLLLTLLRPAAYTTAALWRDPDPVRAIGAFAFLPVYSVWRAWTALTTLLTLGDSTWVRTARVGRSALPQP